MKATKWQLFSIFLFLLQQVRLDELEEVVVVDADTDQIVSPFDDVDSLPKKVLKTLKRALKHDHGGEAIPRAFLQSLVRLIGGYRDALIKRPVSLVYVFKTVKQIVLKLFFPSFIN